MMNEENNTPITSGTGGMSDQGSGVQESQAQSRQTQVSQAQTGQTQGSQASYSSTPLPMSTSAANSAGSVQQPLGGTQAQPYIQPQSYVQAQGAPQPQSPHYAQPYASQPSTQPSYGAPTPYGASPYGASSYGASPYGTFHGAQTPYSASTSSTHSSTYSAAAGSAAGAAGASAPVGAAAAAGTSAPMGAAAAAGTAGTAAGPSTPGASGAFGTSSASSTSSSSKSKSKKASKKSGAGKSFVVSFLGAALACVVMLGGYTLINGSNESSGVTVIGASDNGTITADEDSASLAVQVAEKALPSVVAIDVYTEQQSYGYGWGSSSSSLVETSLGSGVVLTEDGYIITNYHVIEDADALVVTIEGVEYSAEVVGYDESSDIAVIKADATGLTPIEIGDSDSLVTGEWVMTIGSPFGLEQSVATGIVSATSRSQILSSDDDGTTTIYTNLIQTDAAINPGNSGGALVDSDGKLIGINTLITSYSGNYSGVGFAIPVNYAISIAEQIINGETPTHAQLGVSMTTVNSSIAQRYGFSVDSGAYVSAVESGSGADEAGIQTGDIIIAFNGDTISSADDLLIAVRSMSPGDTVEITVNRNGEEITFEVTLGSDESSTSSSTEEESGSPYGWNYGW